jgi:dihydrofolate reductase
MIISLIAAIGKNNELGNGNKLLWNLPADMQHFRDTTRGHTVIMGRKTFESIGRPLPDRENIVVTRDMNYARPGIAVVHSLEEALRLAALEQGKHFEEKQEETEIFVIGGGELYTQAITRAQKLYITRVDDAPAADTFFPAIGPEWKEAAKEEHGEDSKNPFSYTFLTYKKTA